MDFLPTASLHWAFIQSCLASVIMGGIVGLERELKHKPAGFKTHVMITLGSTSFAFASATIHMGDPARIAAQIVSGIGFIGAGTIMHAQHSVHGLTTASTLWVAAAIGLLNGFGLIDYAGILSLIILGFFILADQVTVHKPHREPYSTTIQILDINVLPIIEDMIEKFEIRVTHKSLVKDQDIELKLNYATQPLTQHLFLKRLFTLEGVGEVIRI